MSQMMPPGAPPALQALLQAQGGQGDNDADDSGLGSLQAVIHGVVALLHDLSDPQDKQDATKVLTILMAIQSRLMSKTGASAS